MTLPAASASSGAPRPEALDLTEQTADTTARVIAAVLLGTIAALVIAALAKSVGLLVCIPLLILVALAWARARKLAGLLAQAAEYQLSLGGLWIEVQLLSETALYSALRPLPHTLVIAGGGLTLVGPLGVVLRHDARAVEVVSGRWGPGVLLAVSGHPFRLSPLSRFDTALGAPWILDRRFRRAVAAALEINVVTAHRYQGSAHPAARLALAPGPTAHPSRAAANPVAPTTPAHPPGWYPDPSQQAARRYWDGTAWTGHTS